MTRVEDKQMPLFINDLKEGWPYARTKYSI